jgi:hypothetical protein
LPRTPRATTQRSAKQAGQAEREVIVTLRLPRKLHARLKELGGARGLTAQIRDRLDASLAIDESWDDPLFADLLRAFGYVVVNAALLYPSDPDAYSIVQVAIRMLLDGFRPDSAPDVVHETYVATTVELLGKVDRLLGVALAALGDRGIAALARVPTLNIPAEVADDKNRPLADKLRSLTDDEREMVSKVERLLGPLVTIPLGKRSTPEDEP